MMACLGHEKMTFLITRMHGNPSSGFEKLADGHTSLLLPKLLYVALNLVFLGMGLYKCSSLGLLPSTAADFVSRLPTSIASQAEVSGVPLL